MTPEDFWKELGISLANLRTDYIDVYQFHNPAFCPKPGDGSGLYECMLEAKAQGKIRHIGITNHRLKVAEEAIASRTVRDATVPVLLSGDGGGQASGSALQGSGHGIHRNEGALRRSDHELGSGLCV